MEKQGVSLEQIREGFLEAQRRVEQATREMEAWRSLLAVRGVEGVLEPKQNKSELVREFVKANAGAGYREIKEGVRVEMGDNFLYNLIAKWKKAKLVKVKGGKIFWAGE